jgi:hypothetical protein
MRELNIFERILNFLRYDLRTYFCSHKRITTYVTADELLNTYCQYGASCSKCNKSFMVEVKEAQK